MLYPSELLERVDWGSTEIEASPVNNAIGGRLLTRTVNNPEGFQADENTH